MGETVGNFEALLLSQPWAII